jgi:hypothetical protein
MEEEESPTGKEKPKTREHVLRIKRKSLQILGHVISLAGLAKSLLRPLTCCGMQNFCRYGSSCLSFTSTQLQFYLDVVTEF